MPIVLKMVPICLTPNKSEVIVGINDHCEPSQMPIMIEPTYSVPGNPEAITMLPIPIVARVIAINNGLAKPLVCSK